MPRVRIDDLLNLARQADAEPPPQVIEGEATDITPERALTVVEEPTAPPVYRIPPGPLRQLNTDRLSTKEEVMEQLNSLLPLNKFGLPEFIYRCDLIDNQFMLDKLRELKADPNKEVATAVQDMLSSAMVQLNYIEGYPRLQSKPFWDILPFETEAAYLAFKQYVLIEGVRQLDALDAFNASDLESWYHLYMWAHRSRAYDMYRVAHHQRQRAQRAMNVENTHYTLADALIAKLKETINGKDKEWWDGLSAKDLALLLEKSTRIQRFSVGLGNDAKSINASSLTASKPVENVMELIAGPEAIKNDEGAAIDEELADNPAALEAAQDLIVSLNGEK